MMGYLHYVESGPAASMAWRRGGRDKRGKLSQEG
jgi:hypothetical protein